MHGPTAPPSPLAIFNEALERDSFADRAVYLDRACAGDPALRARVEGLLSAARRFTAVTVARDPPRRAHPSRFGLPPPAHLPTHRAEAFASSPALWLRTFAASSSAVRGLLK